MNKTILVTGGAGFIGANFIPYFLHKYEVDAIVNLDKLTYAGKLANLAEVAAHPRYHFVQGDIVDRKLVHDLFAQYNFSGVIHFAAESHVDNSIVGPANFVKTNIEGTFVLLDEARLHWSAQPFASISIPSARRFLHISTDEVYGTLGPTGLFTEETPYAPNSPYSATKASSDLLVRSYVETYGLNAVIINSSNNYGPKQHPEKLIPTIIRHALARKPIPIYGDGLNSRDWLYVADHCKGIDLVFHQGKQGEKYNIGGKNEQTNLAVVHKIGALLDKKLRSTQEKAYTPLITFVKDRPGHDKRYAIDTRKIENKLGWKAEENFDTGMLKTVEWYMAQLNTTI